jgi:hypothetical protein
MPNAHEERRLVFEEYAQIKSDGDWHLAVTCFWVVPVLPMAFVYHQQMRETSRVRLRFPWTRGGKMME